MAALLLLKRKVIEISIAVAMEFWVEMGVFMQLLKMVLGIQMVEC